MVFFGYSRLVWSPTKSDYQKWKVYQAEDNVIQKHFRNHSIKFLNKFLNSCKRYFKKNDPKVYEYIHHVVVVPKTTGKFSECDLNGRLELLKDHQNKLVVLHELTHFYLGQIGEHKAKHSELFCQTLLWMVSIFLPRKVYLSLVEEYTKEGVHYTPRLRMRNVG